MALGLMVKLIVMIIVVIIRIQNIEKKSTKSKNKALTKFKKITKNSVTEVRPNFLTSINKKAFNQLQFIFIKASIF